MIKIENVEVQGFESAIRGMRNPMNSWARRDSYWGMWEDPSPINPSDEPFFFVGPNDHDLMMRLAKAGSEHAKYRRMIVVWCDVVAPRYWWTEADTYKVGTVANSCSTMHKIAEKEFTLEDFSCEHLEPWAKENVLGCAINGLNLYRSRFVDTKDKRYWWQMIQLLPQSYNQRRTLMLNYEVLSNIYRQRKNHKLDEWRDFCKWIETLPYSEIITV